MKKILFLFLFVVSVSQQISAQSVVIGTERKIRSEILKEDRTYFVYTPEDYDLEKKKSYPVLYVLDGDEYFWLAASAVRYLANRGFMPQTIVVGIDNSNHRDRDLTPTKDDYSPTGGGAEEFLAFMKNELMPEVKKTYRTQPHQTIFGASYGGLFALYVLYNHPDTFDNYLAVSPSLFHDNGLVFKQSVSFFDKKQQKRKFVFLSLADESWTEMRLNFNNTLKLYKAKADAANIGWAYRNYDDETHESTKLVGLNDGLRELHQHWFVPFYQRDRGIAGVKEHFRMLNEIYGYPIAIPEELVNRIARNNLREKKVEEAKGLFQYNLESFPNSPNVYDAIGGFFETQKNLVEAEKFYKLAIAKAREQKFDSKPYEENLKRILTSVSK